MGILNLKLSLSQERLETQPRKGLYRDLELQITGSSEGKYFRMVQATLVNTQFFRGKFNLKNDIHKLVPFYPIFTHKGEYLSMDSKFPFLMRNRLILYLWQAPIEDKAEIGTN